MIKKFKIVGAGGISSYLIEPLARYLSYRPDSSEITVIDGDRFEERNKDRQKFTAYENKAVHTVALLKSQFHKISFKAKDEYLTESNVITNIRENDVVFLCVDNHASRKLISDRCEELQDVTLISGGNDFTDGNVIYFSKKNGTNITKPPTELYPEIASPQDKNPGESDRTSSCQQEAASSPQLLFTNLAIASTMLNCYYAHEQGKADFEQVYLDIVTQRSRPVPEKY